MLRVTGPVRRVALVLVDQLDPEVSALAQLDKARDAVVMFEVGEESTHVLECATRLQMVTPVMGNMAPCEIGGRLIQYSQARAKLRRR